MDQYLIFILISLVFSALLSGIEIAFISSNKLHIELKGQNGSITSRILSGFQNKPSQFIGTTLIGNTMSLVVYGIFMAKVLEPVIISLLPVYFQNEIFVFIFQTIISTIIVLITAEFIPKSIFLINPNRFLTFFSIPMAIIYYALYPFVYVIVGLSKFVIKNLGFKYSEATPAFGLTDLNDFIKRISNLEDSKEEVGVDPKLFHNALELKNIKVRECMVPRTEFSSIDIENSIEELTKEFVRSGHSKVIVYKDSIDEVVGYIHSSELFKKPEELNELITPFLIVPETMLAYELMIQFIKEHRSIALVVDEYGGTSGLVSMEDIIEEIFGDILDEHDEDELIEDKIDQNNFILSARHEIDYLNEKYTWNLPTGDYETLGGFILQLKGDLPNKGEEIQFNTIKFTVLSVEDNKIDMVKVELQENIPAQDPS